VQGSKKKGRKFIMLRPTDFFDLKTFEHAALFDDLTYAWEAIPKIAAYIQQTFDRGTVKHNPGNHPVHPSVVMQGKHIHIGAGTKIDPGVYIEGPVIIGRNCELRQGAYIRSNVILGDGAMVGHATEVKNAVLFPDAHAPHFAYVGDSLLGARVNLGAGTKLSNLAVTSTKDAATNQRPTIILEIDGQRYDTGLTKFGAVLGDDVQIGCNSVTNPGCVIGPRTLVYALASLTKGYYPADSVIKVRQQQQIAERR
jgi:NDP-sugar pyrophosphorylase family protein